MKLRRNSGATLALIAGSIIFLVIVALAFYFVTQLLGGGRELQHATNSGTLNVAKQAIASPKVDIPIIAGATQDTKDMKEILIGVLPDSTTTVDLLHFNRMVGAALLVAANAEADGNGDAVTNAQNFIDLVEQKKAGPATSVGQALNEALANGPAWAKGFFDNTAGGNSLRMLSIESTSVWQNGDFKVGYLAAGAPSNINLNFLRKGTLNNLPFTNIDAKGDTVTPENLTNSDLPAGSSKTDAATDESLVLGYSALNFTKVGRDIFAVPLDTTPHLVSLTEFKKAETTTTPPGQDKNVALPPNAFMNGALGRDKKEAKADVHMLSAAMAGSAQRAFDISMPYGYIVIDNHNTERFKGIVPNANNVFAKELGEGIDVDPTSKYFDNDGQIREWHKTSRGPTFSADSGPAWDQIFDKFGEPVQSAQQVADNVPFTGDQSTAVSCTHSNSDKTSPGAVTQCVNLAEPSSTNPKSMSPFDWAYHKNDDQTYGSSGSIDTSNLTASEQTGCKLIDTWEKAASSQIQPPYTINFDSPTVTGTGIRLYPVSHNPIKGESAPWAKSGEGFNQFMPDGAGAYSSTEQCKVTVAGTMAQLIDQTMSGTPDRPADPDVAPSATTPQAKAVGTIIRQRMHEIMPATPDTILAEFNATVAKQRLELGHTYYLFLDKATGNKHFKITDNQAPPWVAKGELSKHVTEKTDGTRTNIAKVDYGVAMTMADAKHQWGIHDTPFLHVDGSRVVTNPGDITGNGNVKAKDRVFVTPNSGAFGNLLNVTFQETTNGNGDASQGVEFTDRD